MFLHGLIVTTACGVIVVAGLLQHLVGNEILTGAVTLDNGRHHLLRYILVVGQQLFRVLGQTVATIAERRVVIVGTDTRIESDTLNNGLGIQSFHLGIGVEFVEIAHTQGEVGIGEELHGLSFFHAHEENGNILFNGTFNEEGGEGLGGFLHLLHIGNLANGLVLLFIAADLLGVAHDDARGIEVVVQGLALTKELGREEEVELFDSLLGVLEVQTATVTHGDGALDDHHGIGVDREDQVDDILDVMGVEEVPQGVVVGGCSYDNIVGILVGRSTIEGGGEVELLLGEILLDVVVLNGGTTVVDHVNLLGDDIYCCYLIVLGE